jgi:hypothetical protein
MFRCLLLSHSNALVLESAAALIPNRITLPGPTRMSTIYLHKKVLMGKRTRNRNGRTGFMFLLEN